MKIAVKNFDFFAGYFYTDAVCSSLLNQMQAIISGLRRFEIEGVSNIGSLVKPDSVVLFTFYKKK